MKGNHRRDRGCCKLVIIVVIILVNEIAAVQPMLCQPNASPISATEHAVQLTRHAVAQHGDGAIDLFVLPELSPNILRIHLRSICQIEVIT